MVLSFELIHVVMYGLSNVILSRHLRTRTIFSHKSTLQMSIVHDLIILTCLGLVKRSTSVINVLINLVPIDICSSRVQRLLSTEPTDKHVCGLREIHVCSPTKSMSIECANVTPSQIVMHFTHTLTIATERKSSKLD